MLANAFNAYYLEQKSDSTACDFSGAAQVVKAASAASSCSSIVASATANAPGSTNTAATSTTKKKSDASSVHGASLGMGMYFYATYASIALLSGIGMLWL